MPGYFCPLVERTSFDVRVDSTLDVYTDSTYLASLDLIIQSMTMSEISEEQEKGLLTAIENGVNIAGWHGVWQMHSEKTRIINSWLAASGWHTLAE